MKSERDIDMKLSTGVSVLALMVIYSCKRSYAPPAITANNNNYLVVEGVIAAGQDSTIIKLSRTVQISGATTVNPELNATVTVQGDQNVSYNLSQIDTGKYGAPPLNLDNSHKYRLLITTADGQTYASDYEPVKITPPIDSLWFTTNSNSLNINAAAHDPSNNTRYYRWDYTETYIYMSPIEADYIFDPTQTDTLKMSVLRTPEQQIHTCYITLNSSAININSSAVLSRDVIANDPITQIADTSEKILHRYSILVRQYALTQDAYNFWAILKRNTQQIGTIFDVQPSETSGNIYCTSNPALPVLGYISVSSISQKRIFIDRGQLPAWPYPAPQCQVPIDPICWLKGSGSLPAGLVSGIYIPTDTIRSTSICYKEEKPSYSVYVDYYSCADCRYHLGGKTVKPDFWKLYGQ
jgi:hypothetical protein